MRTPILTCLLLFLACVLTTAPASYGQEVDPPAPPTLDLPEEDVIDFRPDYVWNSPRELINLRENVVFNALPSGINAAGYRIYSRVITAHSPGSVAGKWQYRSTQVSPRWIDLPELDEGEGYLVFEAHDTRNHPYGIRFVPLDVPGIAVNDALTWEKFAKEVADADTLPTLSLRLWDGNSDDDEQKATLASLVNSISLPETEKTITLEEITGDIKSRVYPRFHARFSEDPQAQAQADFFGALGTGQIPPLSAAGDNISGRIITAHSPGSVPGKWQYRLYDHGRTASPWQDLPAVGTGEGFLLESGIDESIRFIPLDVELDDVLAVQQFAEAIASAETPPTLSFRPWDASQGQGTTETVATLADLGNSVFSSENEQTISLSRVINTTETERLFAATEGAKAAKIDALVRASEGILAVPRQIRILEDAGRLRDDRIDILERVIENLRGGRSANGAVLHVVAASSADEGPRAYPNPASHLLQVAGLAPAETYTYRLYTSSGRNISQGTLQTNEPIDISSLDKGQYLLTIQDETGKQLFTTPFVVQ